MNKDLIFIDSDSALTQICGQLQGCSWLAVDTEFERVNTYYPELCLLQMAGNGMTVVIDPLAIADLKPLYDLLYAPSILKVFHAARQDLEIFFHSQGEVPVPLFDTQIAASLCGYEDQIGYGTLVESITGHKLPKLHTRADWEAMYTSFGAGGVSAFVQGGAAIVSNGLGLSVQFSATLLTVMAVLFAGTTMDAGVRLQRYIVQEWGVIYNLPLLKNGYLATLVAVAACLVLAFGAGGSQGTGGMIIWPLFGTTNQLLAGLTLLVISVMLVKLGRPAKYTMIPMVFVTSMAFLSALYQLWDLYASGNYLLVFLDVLIIIAAVFVMLEASSALMREKRSAAEAVSATE